MRIKNDPPSWTMSHCCLPLFSSSALCSVWPDQPLSVCLSASLSVCLCVCRKKGEITRRGGWVRDRKDGHSTTPTCSLKKINKGASLKRHRHKDVLLTKTWHVDPSAVSFKKSKQEREEKVYQSLSSTFPFFFLPPLPLFFQPLFQSFFALSTIRHQQHLLHNDNISKKTPNQTQPRATYFLYVPATSNTTVSG